MACGESTAPSVQIGIQFVAGNSVTDTAGAILTQALVVEVHDSSGVVPPAGTIVRFSSIVEGFTAAAVIAPLTSTFFGTFLASATDENGRSSVLVRLGFKAGTARILVTVPTLGLIDTATFTVLPGNPARVTITPIDTLLYVGRTYTAVGTVQDAYGNPRTESVSWSSTSGVTVSSTGVVTATTTGRHTITGTAGSVTGNASVSIVPELQLAAWEFGIDSRIVSMDLDGSNRRVLASVDDGGIGSHPMWIPKTSTIIYTTFDGSIQTLRTVDQSGVVNAFIASPPPAMMSHQAEPTPSADGNWVFFSAFNDACGSAGDYCVHRATSNGTSVTLLDAGYPSRQPAPAPDGSKVAFTRSDFSGSIRVLDVTTNTVSAWSVAGQHPAWSPLGTKIAFVAGGRIHLMNPDGSAVTALTSTQRTYTSSPIGWSPDAKWIIARSNFGVLDLIDAATGTALPLPSTQSLTSPSLK
jgi:Tol biopolymer transport system component